MLLCMSALSSDTYLLLWLSFFIALSLFLHGVSYLRLLSSRPIVIKEQIIYVTVSTFVALYFYKFVLNYLVMLLMVALQVDVYSGWPNRSVNREIM